MQTTISQQGNYDLAIESLRRRWWVFVGLCALSLVVIRQLLGIAWSPYLAHRWAINAAIVLSFICWLLGRTLADNHHRGEAEVLPTFGAGNLLTLLRGVLVGWLAGFLFAPWPSGWLAWAPALLYILVIIADAFDGYLARLTNRVTALGATLDVEFDGLGLLVTIALAVQYGQLSIWYLLLGLARPLFLLGIWLRERRGREIYDLPDSANRRTIAGLQMSFLAVALWPILYPPVTTLAGTFLAIPFLGIFLRDWLIVSGRLNPTTPVYVEARRRTHVVMNQWLPLMVRIILVTGVIRLLMPAWAGRTDWVSLFAWPEAPLPQLTAIVFGVFATLAIPLVVLGIASRLASLGVIAAASAHILTNGLHLDNGLILIGALYIAFLGVGRFIVQWPGDTVPSPRESLGEHR